MYRSAIIVLMVSASSQAVTMDQFLDAVRQVETGGQANDGRDAVGDGGRSIGPYQIGRLYWEDSKVPGRWEDVRDRAYAERVMVAYWARYCPQALKDRDWETLARVHNGGPAGHRKKATLAYWDRVRRIINP